MVDILDLSDPAGDDPWGIVIDPLTGLSPKKIGGAGDPCYLCNGVGFTWDHVEPKKVVGHTMRWNEAPCCQACNFDKASKSLLLHLATRRTPVVVSTKVRGDSKFVRKFKWLIDQNIRRAREAKTGEAPGWP